MKYEQIKALRNNYNDIAYIVTADEDGHVTIYHLSHGSLYELLISKNNRASLSYHLMDMLEEEHFSHLFEFYHGDDLVVFVLRDILLSVMEYRKIFHFLGMAATSITEIELD